MISANAVYRAECVFVRKRSTTFQPGAVLKFTSAWMSHSSGRAGLERNGGFYSGAMFGEPESDEGVKHTAVKRRLILTANKCSSQLENESAAFLAIQQQLESDTDCAG